MDAADAERIASARAMPSRIEPFDHFLHAECAGLSVATKVELKNEPHGLHFHRIDIELFLHLGTALLGLDESVTKRCYGSVPESLTRILLHRADNVLRILSGLIFIEKSDDFAHHRVDGFGLVTDGLSDGDDPNAMLGESAQVEFLLEGLPEKSAVAEDDDKSEGVLAITGPLDHSLEDGPAIVDGGCARFDEFG